MITVEVKLTATGKVGVNNHYAENSFVTPINLSWEEAQEYYKIGRIFNMGLWYDSAGNEHEDNLMRVTSCTLVSEN
jgi:hypothetical protein